MYTELDLFLLDAAKGYIRSLTDEQFLALTCDHSSLLAGLVRLVRNQSSARGIDPTANTAKTFRLSTRQIRNILKKTWFSAKAEIYFRTLCDKGSNFVADFRKKKANKKKEAKKN